MKPLDILEELATLNLPEDSLVKQYVENSLGKYIELAKKLSPQTMEKITKLAEKT